MWPTPNSAQAAVKFYKQENIALQVSNLDMAIDLALKYKRINKPLSAAQKKQFVQWLYYAAGSIEPSKKMGGPGRRISDAAVCIIGSGWLG